MMFYASLFSGNTECSVCCRQTLGYVNVCVEERERFKRQCHHLTLRLRHINTTSNAVSYKAN